MVAREFLRELEKTQEKFRWDYTHDNRIRGFLKTDPTRTAFDPIAAVSYLRKGQASLGQEAPELASELGLSVGDAAAILDASDGLLWKQIEGQTVLDGYCEWLRDGIALTIGLEPFEQDRRPARDAAPLAMELIQTATMETQQSQ